MKITCKIEIGSYWNTQSFQDWFIEDANRIMPVVADKIRNTPIQLPFLPMIGMMINIEDFNGAFKLTQEELRIVNLLVGCNIIAVWIKPNGITLRIGEK